MANKTLHRMAIPLRSIAAGELYVRQQKSICHEANTLDATSVRNRLFQCLDTSTEIDMECCSIHHEGGYGLDTGRLRFFQTRFVVAEMDDLNIVFRRVKCVGYVLFGGNAYGAARVIENGFGFQ